jgi:CTP:molybdopterin cytidylyltransferase MocA
MRGTRLRQKAENVMALNIRPGDSPVTIRRVRNGWVVTLPLGVVAVTEDMVPPSDDPGVLVHVLAKALQVWHATERRRAAPRRAADSPAEPAAFPPG